MTGMNASAMREDGAPTAHPYRSAFAAYERIGQNIVASIDVI